MKEIVIHATALPICPNGDSCETLSDPRTGHRAGCCQSIVRDRRVHQCRATMSEMIEFIDAATGEPAFLCADCEAWHYEAMCGRCQESVLAEIHAERRGEIAGRVR